MASSRVSWKEQCLQRTDIKFQLSIGESYGASSSQEVLHITASEDYRKEPRLQIDFEQTGSVPWVLVWDEGVGR